MTFDFFGFASHHAIFFDLLPFTLTQGFRLTGLALVGGFNMNIPIMRFLLNYPSYHSPIFTFFDGMTPTAFPSGVWNLTGSFESFTGRFTSTSISLSPCA